MALKLDLNKTVEQNINNLYTIIKKNKAKIKKIQEVILEQNSKQDKINKEEEKKKQIRENTLKTLKLNEWFTRFRWFITSNGLLVIGGRDATSNEVIIKKYSLESETIFHSTLAGSPFFVVKNNPGDLKNKLINSLLKKNEFNEEIISEVADATLSYSKAFEKYADIDVFYVKGDQVTKTAESGEYLSKGSFVIRGKRNIVKAKAQVAIGLLSDNDNVYVVGGPFSAISTYSDILVKVVPGSIKKKSDIAKKIRKILETKFYKKNKKRLVVDVNEIINFLPNGKCSIKQ